MEAKTKAETEVETDNKEEKKRNRRIMMTPNISHQGIWNMEIENTINGFSSEILRNGQERRIRSIYETS